MNHVDITSEPQKILSLCTGSRGLERGLERAGVDVRTVCFLEIEAFICENLVQQMEKGLLDEAPIWTDLKTFPYERFHGKIHGFVGGYPCQPFSVAGQRKGETDPRHLWPFIKDGIKAIEPVWCFFENVPGHLTMGFEQVTKDLEELHYRVEAGIFSAEEVGAPHRRERLFILAIKMDNSESNTAFRLPIGTETEYSMSRKSSEELANTNNSGSGKDTESSELRTGSPIESSQYCRPSNSDQNIKRRLDRWPAGPGKEQYEWEAPRTEPMLGFTVNRYNYREDLLRMAGNAVVEQTAELAFKTLLEKFNQLIV